MKDEVAGFSGEDYFPRGFQISQQAWVRLQMDEIIQRAAESPGDRAVKEARQITDKLNEQRDFQDPSQRPARTGELLALGLLTQILRYIAVQYCESLHPGIMREAFESLSAEVELAEHLNHALPGFVDYFPHPAVREGRIDRNTFLDGDTGQLGRREEVGIELALLDLIQHDRAAAPFRELHDDKELKEECDYGKVVGALEVFFAGKPVHPVTRQSLFEMLRAPIVHSPDDLIKQLDFVRSHWTDFLPVTLVEKLLIVQGVIREENLLRGLGPGPARPLRFGWDETGYEEYEAFSIDKDWMPNVVLIAKTVYVWLDQLSKKYKRAITRLDEIPDEELDQLANWGFTALWLIGFWERSPASQTIKKKMGNPEAISSAYSLYDYDIAYDLGGEEAYKSLADRAWKRGIRLASDMVPNHMGLYSRWVVEHPDWFVQQDFPPYPSYQFNGPNLSNDDRIGLFIEDGYWNHSDAAVVFKRVDHGTGEVRYIYHGNDGTSMPWNDTAQLNFLIPEVREAVINTILHVARMFPIIRFDAAMTLAKKHFQRLWFPKPGDAGAVPSRAEHSMSRADFDAIFPVEFWREVVDRVAVEAPDTLLLAEAFWLMEGYFVRTLGMHRVYNSAFMNMLKMEENANYRQTIKNVLEFSPEVLQRFVNFMNNPDEDTAEAQFGKGDKYFGVAMLLATMPGLPMFGHGQIEGYTEKYGMEYQRAYWDESVDEGLVARHEKELFPLMRMRYLFSGAKYFALYDFVTPDGWVNENVFAYSNRCGHQKAIVVYNNSYDPARGTIHRSTSINVGTAESKALRWFSLAEALDLNTEPDRYYIVRDHHNGLEYLYHADTFSNTGLYFDLTGYQYAVYTKWREVRDEDASWGRLHAHLGNQGVPSVEDAYLEMHLASILEPFRKVFSSTLFEQLAKVRNTGKSAAVLVQKPLKELLNAIQERIDTQADIDTILEDMVDDLDSVLARSSNFRKEKWDENIAVYVKRHLPDTKTWPVDFWSVPLSWAILRHLGAVAAPERQDEEPNCYDATMTSSAWMREWFLTKQLAEAFEPLHGDSWRAGMAARLVRICIAHSRHLVELQTEIWGPILHVLFNDNDVIAYLQVNYYGGRRWLNKEQLEKMLFTVFLTVLFTKDPAKISDREEAIVLWENIKTLCEAAADVGYDLDAMLDCLK